MSIEKINLREEFVSEIRDIIISARSNAIRSVDRERVQMYWRLGERIFNEEQEGEDRAEYGSYLIPNLSARMEYEFGNGFSVRQLEQCRQFYRTYPIANALRAKSAESPIHLHSFSVNASYRVVSCRDNYISDFRNKFFS